MKIAIVLFLAYSLLLLGFYIAMCQRPEVFAKVMTRIPNITFLILLFKPMWLHARKGKLKPGDYAPDFSLETYDKKSKVQLSSFRGQRPVVLVFGSYT